LTEHGDKIGAEEKAKIEAALKDAEEALKGNDKATIEAKTKVLGDAAHKLAEQIYAKEQAQTGAGASAGQEAEKPADENVVDAEFEEVKENK